MKRQYKYNRGFEPMKEALMDDSCGIMPAPLEANKAIDILTSYLLGDDWYVEVPVNGEQCNLCIVYQILKKYSKKWEKDYKHYIKNKK
jgi:hypothetical protein